MDLSLAGKKVVVTGGSKGIGRAIVDLFVAEGAIVIMVARDSGGLDEAADAIVAAAGVRPRTFCADLSRPDEVVRLAAEVGDIDVLVNNAGAIPPGSLGELSDEAWRTGWDLKVFGYIALCREIYPRMARRGTGVIVNVIGTKAEKVDPNFVAASSGNAALVALTRALGEASPKDGVRVVGVSPGPVETEFFVRARRFRSAQRHGDPQRYKEDYATLPFGRPAHCLEIAASVVFLASPLSGYTTGAVLTIDGGGR